MNPFVIEEVDDRITMLHIPAAFIPEEIQNEALANLNENYALPHFGNHENNASFGLMFIDSEISVFVMVGDMVSNIPLNIN